MAIKVPTTLNGKTVSLTSTDATTAKTVVTAGTYGSWLQFFTLSFNDPTDRDVIVTWGDGTTPVDFQRIPLTIGTATQILYNVLDPTELTGLDANVIGLALPAGWTMTIRMASTLSSGKTLNAIALWGDYPA